MTLLRIIESTLPVELASRLDLHAGLARSDGWEVTTVFVPRRDPKANPRGVVDIAEQHIWPWLETNPDRPHVMVIGDVPIPRSGLILNPDNHGDTTGAYPCPAYWATGPEGWTDVKDNKYLTSNPVYEHTAGDYVWDQGNLPASARCAIGILNLRWSSQNRAWGWTGLQSTWLVQAYQRWFDWNARWRQRDVPVVAPFAHGHLTAVNGSAPWKDQTDSRQEVFRSATNPKPFVGPYGCFYDYKALPPAGTFWTSRTIPVAGFYPYYESYQTNQGCTREQFGLQSGSAAVAPVGFEWDMTGWRDKTVGELWQQTATAGRKSWIALYGDPTFRIPNPTQ